MDGNNLFKQPVVCGSLLFDLNSTAVVLVSNFSPFFLTYVQSEHVQLCGVGASNFSQKMGLEKVSDEVFKTPKQIRSLEKCLAIKSKQG